VKISFEIIKITSSAVNHWISMEPFLLFVPLNLIGLTLNSLIKRQIQFQLSHCVMISTSFQSQHVYVLWSHIIVNLLIYYYVMQKTVI